MSDSPYQDDPTLPGGPAYGGMVPDQDEIRRHAIETTWDGRVPYPDPEGRRTVYIDDRRYVILPAGPPRILMVNGERVEIAPDSTVGIMLQQGDYYREKCRDLMVRNGQLRGALDAVVAELRSHRLGDIEIVDRATGETFNPAALMRGQIPGESDEDYAMRGEL